MQLALRLSQGLLDSCSSRVPSEYRLSHTEVSRSRNSEVAAVGRPTRPTSRTGQPRNTSPSHPPRGDSSGIATVASQSTKHAPFTSVCLGLAPQFIWTSVHSKLADYSTGVSDLCRRRSARFEIGGLLRLREFVSESDAGSTTGHRLSEIEK